MTMMSYKLRLITLALAYIFGNAVSGKYTTHVFNEIKNSLNILMEKKYALFIHY